MTRNCYGKSLWQSLAGPILATYHPSAILRPPNEDAREKMRQEFTADLQIVANTLLR
jgi:uracil-DNA glycosylase